MLGSEWIQQVQQEVLRDRDKFAKMEFWTISAEVTSSQTDLDNNHKP